MILLEDGTAWRVADGDDATSALWNDGDSVVIIDEVMHLLDPLEQVSVHEV
ncbi:MAG: hypothetical protein IPK12_08165 [Gemmatimonadetes bacterium]|nr:hypothetical protein [Gemmatimonadota bacterium]